MRNRGNSRLAQTLPSPTLGAGGFLTREVLDGISRLEAGRQSMGRAQRTTRPRSVERALQELDAVANAASDVLAGVPGADLVFRQLVAASTDDRRSGEARQAQSGRALALRPEGLGIGRFHAAVRVLDAGLVTDMAERNGDPTWTQRARSFVDRRLDLIDRYTASLDPGFDPTRSGDARASHVGPLRELGVPLDPEMPDVPYLPGDRDAVEDEASFELFASAADPCLTLYEELLADALRDPAVDLIHTVTPNCLCHGFDSTRTFAAEPERGQQFPHPLPRDMMLVFRGEDITSLIVHAEARRIEFRLPSNPRTGFVHLRRLTAAVRQRRADLAKICGDILPAVPDAVLLERSPGALISISHPPVIEEIRIRELDVIGRDGITLEGPDLGKDVYEVSAEACRPVDISWRARQRDSGSPPAAPACANVEVAVRDTSGWTAPTTAATGSIVVQDATTREFSFQATSRAGESVCGTSPVFRLRVDRWARLRLRLDPPGTTQVAVPGPGSLLVSCSCPAPAGGRTVQLAVSPTSTLAVPDFVVIPRGATQARVSFAVLSNVSEVATVTATAVGHRSASLTVPILQTRAIVLSGGGAKGSFQAGAVAYFRRERWDEVEPDIVVGTSVGAINALGIAEGASPAGSLNGIERMERVWLGLRENADMYVDSVWVTRLKELFSELRDPSEYVRPEWIVPGLLLGGHGGGLLGFLAGAGDTAADKIGEIIELIPQIKFLYSLAPTRALVSTNVRFDRIAASGKRLRLATVCLEDGLVYHVTEAGELVSDVGRDPPFTGTLDGPLAVRLTNGAMASAGIPAFFPFRSEPVAANGTTTYKTLVDGGVREVLPIRTATDLGARFVIAVSAGPNRVLPYVSPISGETITQFRNESILDIALRSVDLATREVAHTEVLPDGGFCDDVDRVMVVPSFEIHDTQEIDPGLILINMAYGYMRAFEMYARFRGAASIGQLGLLILLTDQIASLRKQIWELEQAVLMLSDVVNGARPVSAVPVDELPSYRPEARFFDGPTLREIRRLKQEVFNLVVERVDAFGGESVPKRFDDPSIGYLNPIANWWTTWERHREPLESLIRGFDPWSPLPINVSFGNLGTPVPVFENAAPAAPELPPDVASQLA